MRRDQKMPFKAGKFEGFGWKSEIRFPYEGCHNNNAEGEREVLIHFTGPQPASVLKM